MGGTHPILWHPMGHLSSEAGVQQRDRLGPVIVFCHSFETDSQPMANDWSPTIMFHAHSTENENQN